MSVEETSRAGQRGHDGYGTQSIAQTADTALGRATWRLSGS